MKIIFFTIIVSVGSSLGSDFYNINVEDSRSNDPGFSALSPAEYLLVVQHEKKVAEIVDALQECNSTLSVPWKESIELFQNAGPGIIQFTNKPAKCLMNCVMRKDGVMTDEGFKEDVYLRHIKQLRYNYTTYDVYQKSPEQRQQVLDAIDKLGASKQNYELIQIYEWAANECKDKKDPEDDECETSWMIARCIVNRSRERHFNPPFYPIDVAKIK